MADVKLDLIRNSRVVNRVGHVMEIDRIARVSGVGTFDSGTPIDILTDAGLPSTGDQHPDNSNLILEDRSTLRFIGADYGEITLFYRRHFTAADWFAEGTVTTRQVIRYQDLSDVELTVTNSAATDTQYPSINVDESLENIFIEIVEATDTPGATARAFQNKVNSVLWLGDLAGTWRCVEVSYRGAILTVFPQKWRFVYYFAYNENGWQPIIEYVDPTTGRPPDSRTDGVSVKTVTHYGSVDFGTKFS